MRNTHPCAGTNRRIAPLPISAPPLSARLVESLSSCICRSFRKIIHKSSSASWPWMSITTFRVAAYASLTAQARLIFNQHIPRSSFDRLRSVFQTPATDTWTEETEERQKERKSLTMFCGDRQQWRSAPNGHTRLVPAPRYP